MDSIKYIQGDCHKVIKSLETNSVDLVYTSPPYGTTKCEWDSPLDWDLMFEELFRVLKPNGILVLHCSMPFTYTLLGHKIKPRYHYNWEKNTVTNFLAAKNQPLRKNEEVLVYYKKKGTYNPQMVGTEIIKKSGYTKPSGQNYYNYSKSKEKEVREVQVGRYPDTNLKYNIRKTKPSTGITRTDEMMDFFIKTYSNENDTVLDFTCHNKFSGDRCKELNRNFIGIDIKFDYPIPELFSVFE